MTETPQPSTTSDPGRPHLTPEQQQATLTATSELVQAAVLNLEPNLSDPTLAGAADQAIFGCFASIKRKGKLRGCCGFLGRRTRLLEALESSAKTSATGDVRMPIACSVNASIPSMRPEASAFLRN